MQQKPCLYTNNGMVQDSAILAFSTIKSGIGVSHGWRPISGPYKVTESYGNCIISLDWEPAYDVYRSVISKYDDREITVDTFFSICKSFPFGINKLEAEKIIRDPVRINEKNEIVCVGEIPEGSLINIMHGDTESLLSASNKAYAIAKDSFPGNIRPAAVLFIDCISRALFLEDDFQKELANVYIGDIPLFGALTLGEIANCGMDYLEFYNKTSVVGFLGNDADE